jgi:hypothetical protein
MSETGGRAEGAPPIRVIECRRCGVRARVIQSYLRDSHVDDSLFHFELHADDVGHFLSSCDEYKGSRYESGEIHRNAFGSAVTKRLFSPD